MHDRDGKYVAGADDYDWNERGVPRSEAVERDRRHPVRETLTVQRVIRPQA